MREEDLSTEQPEAQEDARLSDPDADPRRASGHRAPAQQGSLQRLGLIWRVRDRATFRAIAGGRRRRAGPVEVSATRVDRMDTPPRVAYAVSRAVGNSVVRNRVRRRLRAATREHAQLLQPGWGYVVRVHPNAATSTYRELQSALRGIFLELKPES